MNQAPAQATALDPADWPSFRQQGHAMLDDMLGFLEEIRERPVWQPLSEDVRRQFRTALPREGADLAAVHDQFLRDVLPYASGNTHPGFMGWVQGGGTPVGMLAEMLAAGLNSNLGGRDHAPVEVERQVAEWMRDLFGFPKGAAGLFVTGTSMANLTALIAARDAALGMHVRRTGVAASSKKLCAYASTAVHSCIQKAMDVCGVGTDALRFIRTDSHHRIDVTELQRTIGQDRLAGFTPYLIVGTAGTVDIGAIDDLSALADVAEEHGLWFHVDGAFAAMAILAADLAPRLDGIQRADSLAFDFHKWAQVPYSAGFLLLRDGVLQRDAFACAPSYLRREDRGLARGSAWPCDLGIDLSRSFQALKTWFTFMVYGADAIGAAISRTCELARYLEQRILASPELELMAPVQLNVVCFRFRAAQADRVNAQIVIELHEDGEVAPSTTLLDGNLVIRTAIVNHRTRQRDIDVLIERTLSLGSRMRQNECVTPLPHDDEWPTHRQRLSALSKLECEVEANPGDVSLHVRRAQLLSDLGRVQEARDEYLLVLTRESAHRLALNRLGILLCGTGYRKAAQTTLAEAVRNHPKDVTSLTNLAHVLMENGDPTAAREHYQSALAVEPNHSGAHQGMARVLTESGDEAGAEYHRSIGFSGTSVTTLPYRGSKPPVSLLLLVSAAGGNPPVRHLLDDRVFQTHVLTADYHRQSEPIPPHHLVFNAIGDAEVAHKALSAARAILAHTPAPVINSPESVLATGRSDNARRLRGIPGVVAPATVTLPRDLLQGSKAANILARHGLEFPLLLRAPGFHTGRNFVRIERAAELAHGLSQLPGSEVSAIEYLNARGHDGNARKYRVMMIGGSLYPLHVAISGQWKVHYFTADMAENAENRAEDAAFLHDMEGVLGSKALAGLAQIQAALKLDYAGIDFGLNKTGDLLLFEANATMVIPQPGCGEKWAYRWPAVERIYSAFRKMLIDRAMCQSVTASDNRLAVSN